MLRVFEYWMRHYQRTWRGTIVISVANPLLFLLGIGVGLGHLVDQNSSGYLAGVSYVAFFAPGMLAAAAMQTGFIEGSGRVAMAVAPEGAYRSAAITPLSPAQILAGHLLFIGFRVASSSAAFVAVMVGFGVTGGWAAMGVLCGASLTGFAFAAPAAAWAVTLRHGNAINTVFRFVIIPMYMLSGTFFAITQLPAWLQPVAHVLPLYHGAELCRTLSLGTATISQTIIHCGYLLMLAAAGIVAARLTYARRLHP